MFNTDDDDFGFPSSGSSSLSSLFGVDQSVHQKTNESLTFHPPKQPKKTKEAKEQSSTNTTPSVIHAVVVQAYKYIDGNYVKQGKMGAAILGDHVGCAYSLWLYISKQQQITNAKITNSFVFTIQPNNYASFYDDQRQNWSLMFESEQNAVEFAKQIGLTKANSCKSTIDKVIIQDLLCGSGNSVENSDSVEVRYTGWLFSNNSIGQEFENNNEADKFFRFKLNSSKSKVVKGWNEGLIGLKKNGRRLLIIPPNLGYGNQGLPGKVPPNSTLVYDIELTKLKLGKEKDSPRASSPVAIQTQIEMDRKLSDTGEDTVKSRSHSLSQQLSQSPASDKAKIISRMAKMGQQMLPLQGPVVAQADDSDVENEQANVSDSEENLAKSVPGPEPTTNKPVPKPRPSTTAQPAKTGAAAVNPPTVTQPVAVYQPLTLPQPMPQTFMPYTFPQMNPPQYGMYPQPFPPQPPISTPPSSNHDAHLPLLMSETRQQNTEIRLSINKITDKLDQMSMKIDQLHYSSSSIKPFHERPVYQYQMAVPIMDNDALLNNIRRIITENESLRKEIVEKSTHIEAQNFKIADLLQGNQIYLEQSNTSLELRNESYTSQSQNKLISLEQEKAKLVTELNEANKKISALESDLNDHKKKESELQIELNRVNSTIQKNQDQTVFLQEQNADQGKSLDELSQLLKEERYRNKQLTITVTSLEEDLSDHKSSKELLEKNLSEVKKKLASVQKRSEEELDELRSTHEQAELDSLQAKLRKSKTVADSSEQMMKIEEELNTEWQEKCNRLLASASEKHKKSLEEFQEERQNLLAQIEELEKKLNSKNISELESSNSSESLWQQKHSVLQDSIDSLKQNYDIQIAHLKQKLMEQTSRSANPADLFAEVKRIMNSVYHHLRSQFDNEENYSGNEIKQIILNVIKSVTLELMQEQQKEEAAPSDKEQSNLKQNEPSEVIASPSSKEETEDVTEENPSDNTQEINVSDSPLMNDAKETSDVNKEVPTEVPHVPELVDEDDENGKPQPPPPPLFEDDDDDDWIK